MSRGWRLLLALIVLVGSACQGAPGAPPATPTQPPTPMPMPFAGPSPTQPPTPTVLPTPTSGPAPPFTPIPFTTPTSNLPDPRFGVAEGFRNAPVMARLGAGWERVVVSWADIQPNGAGDFSWLGRTIPPQALAGELSRGVHMAGLLQFTPVWAATSLEDPGRSVPRNLDLPDDDPNNYWGRFVYETVRYYAGRIDEWIVWNEPEFKPNDSAGSGSYTWLGSDADFARLMQVAYLAAKRANPNAVVSFPGTSYWIDRNSGRAQFYERYLKLVASDPAAAAHHFYHDAVPLNLYRAPDDLVRVYDVFKTIQRRYGVDEPMWLLELNAMPTDDRGIPCADRHASNPIQTTQAQQAAYAIQALALAAATGYQRIGFYQMIDDDPCRQSAVWGITRDDGSERPVATTLGTAIHAFSGFSNARFAPLSRPTSAWGAWPDDPNSLIPNWQIYEVVFDVPGQGRVTALWNGDGVTRRVRITRHGQARLELEDGNTSELSAAANGQDWLIDLPAATAHFDGDPPGYYFIGGEPRLLFEDGVAANSPVSPPRPA